VDAVLSEPAALRLCEAWGRGLVVDAVRASLDELRAELTRTAEGAAPPCDVGAVLDRVTHHLSAVPGRGPRPVLNLTGTVIHTNLGRAPLADEARTALLDAAGATDVEFDLHTGRRGERDTHVESLLCGLVGAEAATVVNNCAAAVMLVLNTFALGREVPVSRGELVEIGGAFRMPEIMARAGARLVEVGTTNRTHPRDYEDAIGPETGLVMKVHPSNYEIEGFTREVDVAALAAITRARGVPLAWDLGSGALVDGARHGLPAEPLPGAALRAGADLVLFSGDKLLGGPQCGIVVGSKEAVAALRANPMKRALRVDKLVLAALAATLRLWSDPERARREIPAFALLTRPLAEINAVAEDVAAALPAHLGDAWSVTVTPVASQIGSGAQPVERLPSAAVAIARRDGSERPLEDLAARLRAAPVPVVGRVREGALLLDCRTLPEASVLLDQFRAESSS
jgi:L-seryl-tRNA(Ser) seleniumtransferase